MLGERSFGQVFSATAIQVNGKNEIVKLHNSSNVVKISRPDVVSSKDEAEVSVVVVVDEFAPSVKGASDELEPLVSDLELLDLPDIK